MKKKNRINWNDTPSNIISFRYASIAFIIVIILMLIIPKILNYGPGTINTEFDVKMSKISFNTQFSIIGVAVIVGIVNGIRCQSDNLCIIKKLFVFQRLECLKTVEDRHHVVKEKNVVLILPHKFDSLEA